MATPDNVVYYNGVPYISKQPVQNNYGSNFGNFGMANYGQNGLGSILNGGGLGGFGGGMTVEQMIAKGLISPLAPPKPPASEPRKVTPLAPTPTRGWSPDGGTGAAPQGASMDSIINGPQFPKAPMPQPQPGAPAPQGQPQMPAPAMGGGGMPNPAIPQQNFDKMGQDIMAQVLAQRGGA